MAKLVFNKIKQLEKYTAEVGRYWYYGSIAIPAP